MICRNTDFHETFDHLLIQIALGLQTAASKTVNTDQGENIQVELNGSYTENDALHARPDEYYDHIQAAERRFAHNEIRC